MSLLAASAVAELQVFHRNELSEQQALQQLATWAYHYSPIVSAVPPDGLLIEVKGSLHLFGGVEALLHQARLELHAQGHEVYLVVAPTPLAASVLARARVPRTVLSPANLPGVLNALPLNCLRLEPQVAQDLANVGVRTLGECMRLARGDLARRTAPKLIAIIDRLLGRSPDPRPRFKLPVRFEQVLDLPWEVTDAEALMHAAERLLDALVYDLRARCARTERLRWWVRSVDGQRQHCSIGLRLPGCERTHLLQMTREHWGRHMLNNPVTQLGLLVDDFIIEESPWREDLFAPKSAPDNAWPMVLDRLEARLGPGRVCGLYAVAEARPEFATHIARSGELRAGEKKAVKNPVVAETVNAARRPLWLLPKPIKLATCEGGRPKWHGPLQISLERERLETGWWDECPLARDYFIGVDQRGRSWWIYRELAGDRAWYLHGAFE